MSAPNALLLSAAPLLLLPREGEAQNGPRSYVNVGYVTTLETAPRRGHRPHPLIQAGTAGYGVPVARSFRSDQTIPGYSQIPDGGIETGEVNDG